MDTQFDGETIFEPPDIYINYDCALYTLSSGFTLLMKWILSVRKYPFLINKIKNMLKRKPYLIKQTNTKGWNLLHLACANSNSASSNEIVELLINHGININAQTLCGETALHLSVIYIKIENSNEDTMKILIKSGANINTKDNYGFTPLITAIVNISDNHLLNILKILIDAGVDINSKSIIGNNALMKLCSLHVSNSIIRVAINKLINNASLINLQNAYGETALIFAISSFYIHNDEKILEILINEGSNLQLFKYYNGENAFDIFYKNNKTNKRMLKLLVENDELFNM